MNKINFNINKFNFFKLKEWQVSATVVLLVLGVFLSLQFKTQQKILTSLEAQSKEDLITIWKSLDEKKNLLAVEVMKLNSEYNNLIQKSTAGETDMSNIMKSSESMQIITGTTAVSGPGVKVTIDSSAPLLAYDLVDLINELWASGAEAIAINEYRITNATKIAQIETEYTYSIQVGGEDLKYPVVIKAVGDSSMLEKGLIFTGGIIDNLNSLQIYPTVKKEDKLDLPPATNVTSFKYAELKD